MSYAWVMCSIWKSSNRLFAPTTSLYIDGLFCRQSTASMYPLRSISERVRLVRCQPFLPNRKGTKYRSCSPFSPDAGICSRAVPIGLARIQTPVWQVNFIVLRIFCAKQSWRDTRENDWKKSAEHNDRWWRETHWIYIAQPIIKRISQRKNACSRLGSRRLEINTGQLGNEKIREV